jgi:hypothetical protein
MTSVETTPRGEADYASLAIKLAKFSEELTPAEAAGLVVLIEHAKEHVTEVTGFTFPDPEDEEVSGFSFSFGAQGASPIQFQGAFGGLSQFGSVAGSYAGSSFGGGAFENLV